MFFSSVIRIIERKMWAYFYQGFLIDNEKRNVTQESVFSFSFGNFITLSVSVMYFLCHKSSRYDCLSEKKTWCGKFNIFWQLNKYSHFKNTSFNFIVIWQGNIICSVIKCLIVVRSGLLRRRRRKLILVAYRCYWQIANKDKIQKSQLISTQVLPCESNAKLFNF